MTNKIFLFPLSLAVILFASMIIILSPPKSIRTARSPFSPPVIISSPDLSLPVESPLTITGKIDRSWVFEGSFPFELFDENGKSLFVGGVSVPDWTEGDSPYADFRTSLIFFTTATSGTLEIKNDNSSALFKNKISFKIPLTFSRK